MFNKIFYLQMLKQTS